MKLLQGDVAKRLLIVTSSSTMPALVFSVIPAIIAVIPVLLLITRDVFAVIPVVPHKIHLFATRIVFMAVFTPVFGVTRRNTEIHRWVSCRHTLNHYRLWIKERRSREASNIDLSIESGLADSY